MTNQSFIASSDFAYAAGSNLVHSAVFAQSTAGSGSQYRGFKGLKLFCTLMLLLAINGLLAGSASAQITVTTSIAAGLVHSCALTTSGSVQCWGVNSSGQLGDGTTTDRNTPVAVIGLSSGVVAITAGEAHSCALTTSGSVQCWGSNGNGELGDGTTTNRTTPVAVTGLSSGVVAITAGAYHSCALSTSGAAHCWGYNIVGQLGDGTTTNRNTPVAVTGLSSGVIAITAGTIHSCAITSSGAAQCWGNNSNGGLGDGTTTDRTTPVAVTGLSSGVLAIDAGEFHSCALTTNGAVQCWGYNLYGQLGDGSNTQRTTPVAVTGLSSGVVAITAGGFHSCALSTSGAAQCWGRNNRGQLGDGTTTNRTTPVAVTGLSSGVVAITAGAVHSCALGTSGAVQCWGSNDFGQLGDGSNTQRNTPVAVSGLNGGGGGVGAITAGSYHSCALINMVGAVRCWGLNGNGQLGDGSTTNRSTPVAVTGLSSGVIAITAGELHSCALTTSGAVQCWGNNVFGQLGDGTTTQRTVPVVVTGLSSGVIAITAGAYHSCALTSSGAVRCWGYNLYGQLGDGTTTNRTTPVAVTGLSSGVVAITAGAVHSCAITSSGGAQCWGGNDFGQLGDGTTTNRTTPMAVTGLSSGMLAIAAGRNHSCALNISGSAQCWGLNNGGQLGDGTTTNRTAPVAVTGLSSGVVAITAGGAHSCALSTSGAMQCWGANSNGQLGDGTTTQRTTPVAVTGLSSGVVAITAGEEHSCAITSSSAARCWGWNAYSQLGDGTTTDRTTPVAVSGLLSTQSISFNPSASAVIGTPLVLSATSTSALSVIFDTWTPTTCSVSGNTVTFTASELCGIRASQTGNAGYFPAQQQFRLINIGRIDQSIAFAAAPIIAIGGSGTVSASAGGSGNPIVFASSTPLVCTLTAIDSTSVTVNGVGAGTCSITANQAGNATYNPAPQATQTFSIGAQVNQTITFAPASPVSFAAAPITLTASSSSGLTAFTYGTSSPNTICTVAVDQLTVVGVGSCALTANQAGNANYNPATAMANVQIVASAPSAPTISAVAAGNTQATVSFTAPGNNGGSTVTGYIASCGAVSVSGLSSPIVVTGLSNGQIYACSVRAVNAVGNSLPSGSINVIPASGNSADLAITISNGTNFVSGGMPTTYSMVVSNNGSNGVAGARVENTLDTNFSNISWTCSSSNGGQCPATGSGQLDTLVDLPNGTSVTILLTATVSALPETPVSSIASVTPPSGISDPNLANNIASDGPDVRGLFQNGFE